MTRASPCFLAAAWLAAAAMPGVLLPAATPGAPTTTTAPAPKADKIVGKPRTKVSFQVEPEAAAVAGRRYGLGPILRNGQSVFAPPDLRLDPNSGAVTWEPTESQAGDYRLTFVVAEPAPRQPRTLTRHVVIQPGEVTTDRGPVGTLLRQWYAEGSAAGNTGDFYDNRDRRHSQLNTGKFPQLDKMPYTEEMRSRRMDWALQVHFLANHVMFGNSSTASGPTQWGSNSRRAVWSQRMTEILYRQYTGNHLYIYPEHRDHDPGRNGRGGYGDLFPANVPYLITSQGSSGSDRPFMEAVAFTLAAFQGEVKRRLVTTGLLMPTVQMILRASSRNVSYPAEYLTGKAHPTVFEGSNVDPLAMIKMAHAIRLDDIPPMVRLKVVEADEAVEGVDYFDAGKTEGLLETPAAIARVVRSTRYRQRLVVSAADSYDANKRPLKYHWAVLRGDPNRIEIRPLEADGSKVELLVAYHDRRPIAAGAKMESPRVDIGAFVHNGQHYSAPAFVCLYSLASEARTYAPDGRILEVAYDYGDSTIGYDAEYPCDDSYDVVGWETLIGLAGPEGKGLAATMLRKRVPAAAQAELAKAAGALAAALKDQAAPKTASDEAEAERKEARKRTADAQKKLDEAKKALAAGGSDAAKADVAAAEKTLQECQDAQKPVDKKTDAARRKYQDARRAAGVILTENRQALGGSIKDRLEAALNEIKNDPAFHVDNQAAINSAIEACGDERMKKVFLAARDEAVKLGVLAADDKGVYRLTPAIEGAAPAVQRLTKYERSRLEWLHIAAINCLIHPARLNVRFTRNFVHPVISTPKSWRDVYHYDDAGRLLGWTRYDKGAKKEFTAQGALIEKTDDLGRALLARKVQYVATRDRNSLPNDLTCTAVGEPIHYEYDSDKDRMGRAKTAE